MFHGIQDWSCIVDIKSHHIILHTDIHTCVFFPNARLIWWKVILCLVRLLIYLGLHSIFVKQSFGDQSTGMVRSWFDTVIIGIYWKSIKGYPACDHRILIIPDTSRYYVDVFLDHPRYHVYVIWTKLFLGRLIIMPAMLEYSVTAIALISCIHRTPSNLFLISPIPSNKICFNHIFSTSS
jgi:hypothetical protein